MIATFELPGVNKQEIDLHLRDGYLVIEGERRRRPDDEDVGLSSQRRRLQKEHARSSSQGCSLDIVTPAESVPRYQTAIASGDSHPDEKMQFRVQELRFGKVSHFSYIWWDKCLLLSSLNEGSRFLQKPE